MTFSLKDILSPFRVWLRAFKRPFTLKKPLRDKVISPRYRGFHTNDLAACIGCGLCAKICTNEAIDMRPVDGIPTTPKDSGLRPAIDYGRCCWCALCIDICPKSCLNLTNEHVWVTANPDDFVFTPGKDGKPWDHKPPSYRKTKL
jgi:glutamate synthase (NADPH) small chain